MSRQYSFVSFQRLLNIDQQHPPPLFQFATEGKDTLAVPLHDEYLLLRQGGVLQQVDDRMRPEANSLLEEIRFARR